MDEQMDRQKVFFFFFFQSKFMPNHDFDWIIAKFYILKLFLLNADF